MTSVIARSRVLSWRRAFICRHLRAIACHTRAAPKRIKSVNALKCHVLQLGTTTRPGTKKGASQLTGPFPTRVPSRHAACMDTVSRPHGVRTGSAASTGRLRSCRVLARQACQRPDALAAGDRLLGFGVAARQGVLAAYRDDPVPGVYFSLMNHLAARCAESKRDVTNRLQVRRPPAQGQRDGYGVLSGDGHAAGLSTQSGVGNAVVSYECRGWGRNHTARRQPNPTIRAHTAQPAMQPQNRPTS